MQVLVTGGAGYFGSHKVLSLLENNVDVIVYDNLANSSIESIDRVEKLTDKSVEFVEDDICNKENLSRIFKQSNIDAVIHFTALKSVGESAKIPLSYYQNNVHCTVCLPEVMQQHKVLNFIFSSSATVYGEENDVPYVETMKLASPSSPYSASKVMVEGVLTDLALSDKTTPFEVSPRRAGDLPAFWANASKELNWQANRSLDQMMADTWRWQSNNPNGYLV